MLLALIGILAFPSVAAVQTLTWHVLHGIHEVFGTVPPALGADFGVVAVMIRSANELAPLTCHSTHHQGMGHIC